MVRPNALVVGVNKAGTTSIFNALESHGEVTASLTKETHFFDPLKYGEPLDPPSAYDRYFPPEADTACVLEATPGYFYGGGSIAAAIREYTDGARCLIVLREPGSRAFSWWRFARSRLLVPQHISFMEYVERCVPLGLQPEGSRELVGFRGLSGGHYAHWLPAWHVAFGSDLMVMFYDDLVRSFPDALAAIARHFRIEAGGFRALGRGNVTVDIRSAKGQALALSVNRLGERAWRRLPAAKRRLRRLYYGINSRARQEELSPDERAWLDDYFRGPVQELRRMLPGVPHEWGG